MQNTHNTNQNSSSKRGFVIFTRTKQNLFLLHLIPTHIDQDLTSVHSSYLGFNPNPRNPNLFFSFLPPQHFSSTPNFNTPRNQPRTSSKHIRSWLIPHPYMEIGFLSLTLKKTEMREDGWSWRGEMQLLRCDLQGKQIQTHSPSWSSSKWRRRRRRRRRKREEERSVLLGRGKHGGEKGKEQRKKEEIRRGIKRKRQNNYSSLI